MHVSCIVLVFLDNTKLSFLANHSNGSVYPGCCVCLSVCLHDINALWLNDKTDEAGFYMRVRHRETNTLH